MSEGFLNAALALLSSIEGQLVYTITIHKNNLLSEEGVLPSETTTQVLGRAERIQNTHLAPLMLATRALNQVKDMRAALAFDENDSHELPLTTKSTLMSRLMVIEDDQSDEQREFSEINKLYAWACDHGLSDIERDLEYDEVGDFESAADEAASALPDAAKDDDEESRLLKEKLDRVSGTDEPAEEESPQS